MKLLNATTNSPLYLQASVIAPAKPDVSYENQYQIRDGVVTHRADSLEEYQCNSSYLSRAQRLLGEIQSTELLKAKDGTQADFDYRPGHVVLADENFEWHPDTKTLFHESQGKKVVGDGETITIVFDGLSPYAKNHTGIWNTTTGEFSYRRDAKAHEPETRMEYDTFKEVGQATFQISADGKVSPPNAQSLAEAKTLAPQREMSKRAEDLIESWRVWSEKGKGLDQTEADISKKAGTTVAVELDGKQLGISESDPMVSSYHWLSEYNEKLFAYDSFDLETSEGMLTVGASESFEDGDGWSYPTELTASKTDSQLNVTLRTEDGVIEKVQWNIQDGIVNYNKQEKENDEDLSYRLCNQV